MGLKKPSKGGGLPSDVVDKSGAQATFAASTTDSDGTNIRLHSTPTEKTLVDTKSTVTSTAPLYSFGDATVADVVSGKRFTSSAGLSQEGTLSELGELIGIDAYPEVDGEYLVLGTLPAKKCVMDTSASIQVKTALSNLGDATAADVVAGKTFTSAAGVKNTGTGTFTSHKGTLQVNSGVNLGGLSGESQSSTQKSYFNGVDLNAGDILISNTDSGLIGVATPSKIFFINTTNSAIFFSSHTFEVYEL